MNKLEGFYAIEKFKLRHPPWSIVRMDLAESIINNLRDNVLYTIRTAFENTPDNSKDFWLPRFVGVSGKKIKDKFKELKNHFEDEENVFIIVYPFFKVLFSGVIEILFESNPINSSKTIIVESCKGNLSNLTDHNFKDYEARIILSNTNEVMSEKSDIPRWQELRGEILDIVKKLSEGIPINSKTKFRIEWSFTEESFLFYEMKTV